MLTIKLRIRYQYLTYNKYFFRDNNADYYMSKYNQVRNGFGLGIIEGIMIYN